MHRFALAVVVICACAGGLYAEDATSDEANKLAGQWQAVAVSAEGLDWDKDSDSVRKRIFIFQGDQLIVNNRRKTFRLNPEITPKQMDLLHHDGLEKGQRTAAIYKLEDNRLTICMPYFGNDLATRPSEFKTTMADGRMLIILERKKP